MSSQGPEEESLPAGGDASQPTANAGNVSAAKRLQQELTALVMGAPKGISAFPDGDSLYRWIATVRGPEGTVYDGTDYRLCLEFSSRYPFQAPRVRFQTPCFHPNVGTRGDICIDILKDKWSPLLDVRSLLLSIQSLLAEPNVSSPLNPEAAALWSNQELYKEARELFESSHAEANKPDRGE